MYHTLTPWISLGVATLVCGFAIWKGDRWTRFVGGIFLGGWILSSFVATTDSLQPEWGVMVIDVIALLLFIWASLKARKLWTVFAAACQMMAVASHIISIIDLRIYMATVIVGLALLSYGVLIALLFGTASAIRSRQGRRGHDPDSGS